MFRLFRLFALVPVLAIACALVATATNAAKDKEDDPFAELMDKPAPAFTADFALNGKPVKLSDLKGKVVMVDFWAEWCPPCRASFSHLRELNSEYKDKGLELVGVTSYQGHGFDKDGANSDDKLSTTEEQPVLKDFVSQNKLEHRILVLTKDDWRAALKEYKISGIPTVVLLDRKGVVRMVKVGNSKENNEAIEEGIKKLLAEKE